jgi:hypothetical protein
LTVVVMVAEMPTEGEMAVATSAVVAVAPPEGFTTVTVAMAPVLTVATLRIAPFPCATVRRSPTTQPEPPATTVPASSDPGTMIGIAFPFTRTVR